MGRDKLSTCEGAGKWYLVIVNTLFVLLGIALFILGMIVRFSPETILNNYLEPILTQRDQQNPNPNNGISVQIQNQIDQLDLSEIFTVVGIVIIVIGVIMLAVGMLGLFGASCLVRCMLIAYAVVVIVAVVVQFGVCIAYFTQKEAIDTLVKEELQTAINTEYRGEDATDAYSVALNYLFIEGECCGVNSFTDMQSASQWRRNYNYNGQQYTLAHPFTCCKLPGTFPNYQRPADLTCAVTPTQQNSNFDRGCFQAIDEFITANISTTAIAVFVVLGIVQIIAIVFAILLAVAVGRGGW